MEDHFHPKKVEFHYELRERKKFTLKVTIAWRNSNHNNIQRLQRQFGNSLLEGVCKNRHYTFIIMNMKEVS